MFGTSDAQPIMVYQIWIYLFIAYRHFGIIIILEELVSWKFLEITAGCFSYETLSGKKGNRTHSNPIGLFRAFLLRFSSERFIFDVIQS